MNEPKSEISKNIDLPRLQQQQLEFTGKTVWRSMPPRPLLSTYAVTPCARLEIANCRESRKNRKLGVKLTILAKKRETIATKAAKKSLENPPQVLLLFGFFFLAAFVDLDGEDFFFLIFFIIVSRYKSSRLRLTDRNPPG